jgi:hypothetical protein
VNWWWWVVVGGELGLDLNWVGELGRLGELVVDCWMGGWVGELVNLVGCGWVVNLVVNLIG